MPQKNNLRQRLAGFIAGTNKDFILSLSPVSGVNMPGSLFGGRLNSYSSKVDQIQALTGWVFAANGAIADPTAAVEIKLYRKLKDGDREEITSHELLDLINRPNMVHTGKQLRQLHFTYMNIVGESYIYMRDVKGGDFVPARGRLPAALDIFPAHLVQFVLGPSYSKSVVRYNNHEYPSAAFIRDLNPNPMNPYMGRSIVSAAASIIDTDEQMKTWNQNLFANNARPSLIFSSNTEMSDESYDRWKKQFIDDHAGTSNAYKPLLIEGGDAKPYMMSQTDLDFLASRKFSRDEILAMFRLQPGMIGVTENVNRASFESGFYANAVNNVVPRISQFVEQLNATLVSVYDPSLEFDYVSPVPEDVEAKLKAASAGVNQWWTIDEVRDMYGEQPLPNGLGEHIVIQGKGAPVSLDDVLAGDTSTPDTNPQNPEDPDNDGDDDLTESPSDTKAVEGKQSIKKR
jgi:HK97 family phage portal protein